MHGASRGHGGTAAHDHVFDRGSHDGERSTRIVAAITVVAMGVEIAAGWWFNSMALLADGWHMSSHAVAIGLSAVAYASARRYARDPRFAFGSWKIEVLAAFASAIFLLGVAVTMVVASVERIVSPQPIGYREAMLVAVLGLAVNVVCATLLGRAHHGAHAHHLHHAHPAHSAHPAHHAHRAHHSDHAHHAHHAHPLHGPAQGAGHADAPGPPRPGHDPGAHGPHDLNLRSAYLHVLTDAVTSVLAIVALGGGWLYGWQWLDPAMGIVGALLVALWARGLIIETGKVLLDREMDDPVVEQVRRSVEGGDGGCVLTDLHVWRVGRQAYSCAMTVSTHDGALTPQRVRERLAAHPQIAHSTIEIDLREAAAPPPPGPGGVHAPDGLR